MSPLLPSRRRPWLDDPGHIHEETPPPPMPDEQEELGPDETLATSPVRTDSAGREMVRETRGPDQEPAGIPDLNEVDVPEKLEAQICAAMARYPQKLSASIPALWAVQKRYGYCSPEGIRQAAAVMGVTPGHLQSVASFYDLFHLEPQGAHEVLVCTNISCWLRGGDDVLAAFVEAAGVSGPGETSEDGSVYVRGFECLGACDIAPMASIDQRYYGPLEAGDAAKVLEQLPGGGEILPEKRLADRRIAGGPGAKEITAGSEDGAKTAEPAGDQEASDA
ncbi:MAG: NADH-quinone oxidoreductase subunit NuoE family protein [Solirubrobacterales bacterium]